jgi:Trypsin-like peptidase domain
VRTGRRLRLLFILWACGVFADLAEVNAQESDMFIKAIETIKQAIAPVTCTHPTSQRTAEVGATNGTAFFIDTHGVFLTASHVISGFLQGGKYDDCVPSVYVPIDGWSVKELKLQALRFVPSDCRLDETTDLAQCRTVDDPTGIGNIVSKPTALTIENDVQPDGTQVAFSGFPVNALIPYTARTNIAGYQLRDDHLKQQLEVVGVVLDKGAWSGASGAPVYRVDGHVIGMVLQTGRGDTSGLAFARHGARINDFLSHP